MADEPCLLIGLREGGLAAGEAGDPREKGGWCLGFHLSPEQTPLYRACLPTPAARYTPILTPPESPESPGKGERGRAALAARKENTHYLRHTHAASSVLWRKSIPSVVLYANPFDT